MVLFYFSFQIEKFFLPHRVFDTTYVSPCKFYIFQEQKSYLLCKRKYTKLDAAQYEKLLLYFKKSCKEGIFIKYWWLGLTVHDLQKVLENLYIFWIDWNIITIQPSKQ